MLETWQEEGHEFSENLEKKRKQHKKHRKNKAAKRHEKWENFKERATPVFEEILEEVQQDYIEFVDAVPDKFEKYSGLFEDLANTAAEKEVVSDQPSLRGNLVTQNIEKNAMGCLIEESVYDNQYVEKVITAPALEYHLDYV